MRNVHPKIYFRKKYFLPRNMLQIIDMYFFQYNILKFREMNLQNFEIGKIDVFSIGYDKKSLGYKKLLSYGKCAYPFKLFKVMYCTPCYFFF